jgi:outer membrane lipoprotein-sorting protein
MRQWLSRPDELFRIAIINLSSDHAGMKPLRAFLFIVAGAGLLSSHPLPAQATGVPFEMSKQYSAEMVATTKDGRDMAQKIYSDDGKVRSEMNSSGMQMVMIVRPDLKKVYNVMVAQKMAMEMNYDPTRFPVPGTTDSGAKYELVGPDTVDGVSCTKYKMTAKDGKVFDFWIDTDKKAPVKMVAEDGAITMVWKNFVAGPQDSSLFEVPSGYQVMKMPTGAGMPGGGMGH